MSSRGAGKALDRSLLSACPGESISPLRCRREGAEPVLRARPWTQCSPVYPPAPPSWCTRPSEPGCACVAMAIMQTCGNVPTLQAVRAEVQPQALHQRSILL